MVTDYQLVEMVKNGDSDAFLELVNRHSAIFSNVQSKFAQIARNRGRDHGEINDSKYRIFYESCLTYKPEKGNKFSTWLANRVRYFCLNFINRSKPHFFFDDCISNMHNIPLTEKRAKESKIMEILNSHEDKMGAEVCKRMYFFSDRRKPSLKKIAKDLGINTYQVAKIHKIMLKQLKKKDLTFT